MRPQRPCGSTKAVEAIAGPPRARATRQPDCKRRVPALRAAAAGPSARRHSRVAPRAMLGLTRTGVAVGAAPRRRRAAASIVASSSSSSDEVKSHSQISTTVKSHALTRIKSQKSLESRQVKRSKRRSKEQQASKRHQGTRKWAIRAPARVPGPRGLVERPTSWERRWKTDGQGRSSFTVRLCTRV